MMSISNNAQRGCITDVGGFDAGQARIVKLHIDLKMKLHKKLNKDCQPISGQDNKMTIASMSSQPCSKPDVGGWRSLAK